jgi:nucleotide-binding universal stress UspA family protein
MYKHILVPTDGSALSARAIEQAIDLAKSVGAKVTGMKDCEDRAEKFLGAITVAAKAAGVQCEVAHVTVDHPYQGIIDTTASKGCDLIFMASHGRKGVSALVLGRPQRYSIT